jgi:hypothetical protein
MKKEYIDMVMEMLKYAERNDVFSMTSSQYMDFKVNVEDALFKQIELGLKIKEVRYQRYKDSFNLGVNNETYEEVARFPVCAICDNRIGYELKTYCDSCGQKIGYVGNTI